MSPEIVILVRALSWTILHSFWQGAIVAVSIKMILMLIPRHSARIRYHVGIAGLLFLFGWFCTTGWHQWQQLQVQPVTVTENVSGGAAVKTYQLATENTQASDTAHFFNPVIPHADGVFSFIVLLYIAGLLVMLGRMSKSMLHTRRLRGSGFLPAGEDMWQAQVEKLKDQLLLDIPVTLQFSKMVTVPVVMGIVKPLILLPVSILSQLNNDQLEAILLHELAHIKRQDYLVNIVQCIIEVLLFFNPFMWLVSAEIRKEREHCCDDLVVSCTENPLQYAQALAMLEANRAGIANLGLAATGKKQNLFHRIKRIMEMNRENYHYGKLAAVVLIVCGLGISALWFTPSFAQNKKAESKSKTKVWVSDEQLTTTDDNGRQHTYPTLEQWPEKERIRMVEDYARRNMEMYFGPQNKQIVVDPQTGKTAVTVAGATAFSHPAPEQAVPEPPAPPVADIAPPVPPAPSAPIVEDGDHDSDNDGNNDERVPGADISMDVDKIVSNALGSVNWDSIGNTVNIAIKQVQDNVDWKAINKEIRKGFEEAGKAMDDPKVRAEMQRAMNEAKRAMNEARMESHKQIIIAREETRKQVDEARRNALAASQQARNVQIRRMQDARVYGGERGTDFGNMLDQMSDQGLINRDKGFRVEKTDGHLFINGNEQPSSVYDQYRSYLGHDEIHIKGKKKVLSISVTDNK